MAYNMIGKPHRTGLMLVLLCFVVIIPLYLLRTSWKVESSTDDDIGVLRIVEVTDGDTGLLSDGDAVRLIGIDAPEFEQPYYHDAMRLLAELCFDREVRLEYEREKRDKYGRLLAYVFVDDTVFVNERMILRGMANVYIFPRNQTNKAYRDRLIAAQSRARRLGRGVWSLPVPEPVEKYYVGNRKSMRFHRPDCRSVRNASPKNLREGTRDEFLDEGYSPCRNCRP